MKILGQPQVRPDMVFSLLRLLDGNGGAMKEEEVIAWMAPSFAADKSSQLAEASKKLIEDTVDAARSLGFVKEQRLELAKPAPTEFFQFGDALHDALLETKEWDVIDTFASLCVEIEQQGISWISEQSQDAVATRLEELVRRKASPEPGKPKESAIMNTARWAAWRSWATAAGLGLPGPNRAGVFLPHPVRPVERVAKAHPELKRGRELEAPAFLKVLSENLPYLDGGSRWAVAWQRVGDAPRAGASVSFVLSTSLRELHSQKVLDLKFEGGDRAGARQLYDDGTEPEAFATIRLVKEVA